MAQPPFREITTPSGGTPPHTHRGHVDANGNGKTNWTSNGPAHSHQVLNGKSVEMSSAGDPLMQPVHGH